LNDNSFESYTKEGFSKENHLRLCELFKRLSDRGCFCVLTNHNTDFVREMYGDFNIEVVNAKAQASVPAIKPVFNFFI